MSMHNLCCNGDTKEIMFLCEREKTKQTPFTELWETRGLVKKEYLVIVLGYFFSFPHKNILIRSASSRHMLWVLIRSTLVWHC